MSIIRENPKSRGKVYRCFAIYNQDLNEFMHIQKRRCNKSFEASINDVKIQAQQDFKNSIKEFSFKNKQSEWYGLMDSNKKCYFMFMLFPQTNTIIVENALNLLMKQITSIPNYNLLTPEQLDQMKRSDIRKLINQLENDYVDKEGGGMGQPSDDEQAGSKIVSNTQLIKTNGQSSFRSTINQQQQPSKIETKELVQQSTIDREYVEFGVFRGFVIYSVKDKKILFQLSRGSKQAFPSTLNKVISYIQTIKNNNQEDQFVKIFNTKAEWHGKYLPHNNTYFLLMTFQNANQERTFQLLTELITRIKQEDLEQHSIQQINEKLLWHVSTIIKSAEKHFEYDGLGSGIPSDNEQEPKLDQLRKKVSGMSKNYSAHHATKQQILQLEIVSRADLIQMGEHDQGQSSPIQTNETIFQKLTHFEPQANDTSDLLQYSIAITLIILIIIFIYLLQK